MKDIQNFLKNKSKLIIWAIGLLVLWFIWPNYEHEPKFIRENELITWDMVERIFFVILGIVWLQKLTSNHLFRDEDQEEWSKSVNQRIDNIEKKVDLLANWAIKIDEEKKLESIESRLSKEASTQESRIFYEMERDLLEFEQRTKKDLQVLKESHSKLEKRVWDHIQDCPHVFMCNNCDHEDEIFNFISNDDGDLMCPTCHSSASIEEKAISKAFTIGGETEVEQNKSFELSM